MRLLIVSSIALFSCVGCLPAENRPIALGDILALGSSSASRTAPPPPRTAPAQQPAQTPLAPNTTGGTTLGGYYSAPTTAPAAEMEARQEDLTNVPGEREVHYSDKGRSGCSAMDQRFKQEGVRLTFRVFVKSRMPGARNGGWCIFDGPDATDDRFADYRYNSPSEYR